MQYSFNENTVMAKNSAINPPDKICAPILWNTNRKKKNTILAEFNYLLWFNRNLPNLLFFWTQLTSSSSKLANHTFLHLHHHHLLALNFFFIFIIIFFFFFVFFCIFFFFFFFFFRSFSAFLSLSNYLVKWKPFSVAVLCQILLRVLKSS